MADPSRTKIATSLTGRPTILFLLAVMAPLAANLGAANGSKRLLTILGVKHAQKGRVHPDESVNQKLMASLESKDSCGTFRSAALNGYLINTYSIETNDHYLLTLHRLIHPEDVGRGEPEPRSKKPYILLHGPLGSSSSFMMNDAPEVAASKGRVKNDRKETIKIHDYLHSILWPKLHENIPYIYSSVRTQFDGYPGIMKSDRGNKSLLRAYLKVRSRHDEDHADFNLLNFDYDTEDFGTFYRTQYLKTRLPKYAREEISNSLAMTLANFGYDVWMLNLRGNSYSRAHNGPLNANKDSKYWDFDSRTLVHNDLKASIDFVKKSTEWPKSLGLVGYSYSTALILRLLTDSPQYAELLQPIVFMAPGPMSSTHKHGLNRNLKALVMSKLSSGSISFPGLKADGRNVIMRGICKLPLAEKFCNSFEILLNGESNSISKFVFSNPDTKAMERGTACGQTSMSVLRDILDHMTDINFDPHYSPINVAMRSKIKNRRSVMFVHSRDDPISTPTDVNHMIATALKQLALVDYVINEPEFDHTSFIFSEKNRFLVNGEIVRMVGVFDLLTLPKSLRLSTSPTPRGGV